MQFKYAPTRSVTTLTEQTQLDTARMRMGLSCNIWGWRLDFVIKKTTEQECNKVRDNWQISKYYHGTITRFPSAGDLYNILRQKKYYWKRLQILDTIALKSNYIARKI